MMHLPIASWYMFIWMTGAKCSTLTVFNQSYGIQPDSGCLIQCGRSGSLGNSLHELCSLRLQVACTCCSAWRAALPPPLYPRRLTRDPCPLALLSSHFQNWLIIYLFIHLHELCSDLSSSSSLKLLCCFSPSQCTKLPPVQNLEGKIRGASWSNWRLSFSLEITAFWAT